MRLLRVKQEYYENARWRAFSLKHLVRKERLILKGLMYANMLAV
jgi:hypothetical protein